MNDKLINFINYAIENGSNSNLELEARFGKYSKITSNIKPTTFFKVYNLFKSGSKSYSFIKDKLFDDIRKRNEMSDSKNHTKYLFDNPDKILELSQNVIKPISNATNLPKTKIAKFIDEYENSDEMSDKNSFYMTKHKVFKPIQLENMKIDLVMEATETPSRSLQNTNEGIKRPQYHKNKFRCSIKRDSWDIDLTILLITDCSNNQSNLYFEIEIEFNHANFIKKKLTSEQVIEEFKTTSNAILSVIECGKNNPLNVEMRYGMFNQVVTLERQRLSKIINGAYSVTEKADGERVFIYIDDKKNVFRINPTNIITIKAPLSRLEKTLKISNTLIDGEMIDIKGKNVFMGFDLLYYDGINCRDYDLETRLSFLKDTIGELNKLKGINGFEFKVKTFYMTNIFTNAYKIWNNRAKLFPYNLDGLIFTPIRGAYQSNLPNYKWKDKHSIDIRILYNSQFNFTEFHPFAMAYKKKGSTEASNAYVDHKTGITYYRQRMTINNLNPAKIQLYKKLNLVSSRGELGIYGKLKGSENLRNMVDIVEVEYDYDVNKWVYLRTRPDKQKPNAHKTILSVLEAISDNITIEVLSKLKHKKSPYELINKKECYTKIGFNFNSSSIKSNLCDFYTSAYENLFQKTSNSSILVLGCDLCILKAVVKIYKNVLILEPSCLEVYGEEQSEGYSGLIEQLRKLGVSQSSSINIVWGDSNISNGLKAYTRDGQTQIDAFMKKNKSLSAVFVNSFINMIYNNKTRLFDKNIFDKNIKNMKTLINYPSKNTNIIGLFLDGSSIIKYLEKQDCILLKNTHLHPLYKIYLKYKNLSKYNNADLFKITDVKMLEIQRMQNSFNSQEYPLIFNENINMTFKNINMKIMECNSFKKYYMTYKKNNDILNEYDCIILDITKYFII